MAKAASQVRRGAFVAIAAMLGTMVLGAGAPAFAADTASSTAVAAAGTPATIRYAQPPVLGERDWVGPDLQNLTVTSTDSGFDIEFDYSSVASPTIPDLYYGGGLSILAYQGTADTPVPTNPVRGRSPLLGVEPTLSLPDKSSTPSSGHYSASFDLAHIESAFVAVYATKSCDQDPNSQVGCGGSDSLYASAVLPAEGMTIDRVSGADRYEVAANIAALAYPDRANVVFVATGGNYPDALSAGPAAAALRGPLLLTASDTLLPVVKSTIQRLQPEKIVVVGGVNSISGAVFDELKTLQANTVRLGGADRYEASRNLVAAAFQPGGSSTAYIATGANFPDALSAGAAAASLNGPVLLVNGGSPTLDQATTDSLTRLGVTDVVIAGGPNSVSPGIQNALGSIATVVRDGGADRFAASVSINQRAFPTATRAFLATGLKFPDALSGSAWAGSLDAPLYVVNTDCIPQATLAAMNAQGVTHITLLGGTATLTPAVQSLTPCAG